MLQANKCDLTNVEELETEAHVYRRLKEQLVVSEIQTDGEQGDEVGLLRPIRNLKQVTVMTRTIRCPVTPILNGEKKTLNVNSFNAKKRAWKLKLSSQFSQIHRLLINSSSFTTEKFLTWW